MNSVTDVPDASAAFDLNHYDCLVLDSAVPSGDIIEFAREMSADGPTTPVRFYPNRIVLADDGEGIDDAVHEHLFERFHTVPTSNGHGLGPPIVRWIADAQGGTIGVRNRTPSRGTEATLELP